MFTKSILTISAAVAAVAAFGWVNPAFAGTITQGAISCGVNTNNPGVTDDIYNLIWTKNGETTTLTLIVMKDGGRSKSFSFDDDSTSTSVNTGEIHGIAAYEIGDFIMFMAKPKSFSGTGHRNDSRVHIPRLVDCSPDGKLH